MRNLRKDIKEWVSENNTETCAICLDPLFTGANSRTITYLNCSWNSGNSKGHGIHGNCLVQYLSTHTDYTDIDEPPPYRCPICKSKEPFVNYPEIR
jgi:rubrerythrin